MSKSKLKSGIIEKQAEANQKRDIRLFIIVMIVFTIGMAVLLFVDVSAWWIWYSYFIIWTVVEFRIAKNIKLKWWHWVLIIAAIFLVDWAVLELIELMKK